MEKKKRNILLLIIGIIVLITGIIMLVKGIGEYSQANTNYNIAHEQWREAWFNHNASMADAPKLPSPPAILIIGPFGIVIGLVLTGFGLAVAFGKETAKSIVDNIEKVTNSFVLPERTSAKKNITCNYCGSLNKPDATKCSSCGASLSDKK